MITSPTSAPTRYQHSDRERRIRQSTPWATITLILVNLAMYVGELQRKSFQATMAMVGDKTSGPDGSLLFHSVPFPPAGFHNVGVTNGEWYRLFTANFIHAIPPGSTFGFVHILFNMVALWQLGPVLEYVLGRVRFVALYVISGLGSSVFCYLLAPHQESFGASGAVFGLVAAYFVLSRKQSGSAQLPGGSPMLICYLVWFVLSMRFTSWQGHLGGLVTGLAVAAVLAYAPRAANQVRIQVAGIAVVVVLLTAAVAVQASAQKADLAKPASTNSAANT